MDEVRLDGKVVLITGGGRGIGRTYALLAARHGAAVVVADRDPEPANAVADEIAVAGGSAAAAVADIGVAHAAKSTVDVALARFGRLDCVINNAGILRSHRFADYPEDGFEQILDVHVRGAWHVTQAAWPALTSSGAGRVINTVSRAAFFGEANDVAYSAAKAAMYGFTRALALEGASSGIKVNAICPVAWTRMFESSRQLDDDERRSLGEQYRVDYVAPLAMLLAHERCPCTGEILAAVGSNIKRYFVAETSGIHVGEEFSARELEARFADVVNETGAAAIALADYKADERS